MFLGISCGTTGSTFHGQNETRSKNSKSDFWPLDFPPNTFSQTLSAGITVEKTGKTRVATDLKTAIESLKSGEVIRLVAGKYSIPSNVTVPSHIHELIIEGVGRDTIIGFNGQGVEDPAASKIVSTVPVTFRFLSLYRPRVRSESARARIWLEEVFVSDSFAHEGKERFDYRGGLLALLGGNSTKLSASDIYRRNPKFFVSAAGSQVSGTAVYTPANAPSDSPMSVLKLFQYDAPFPKALSDFEQAFSKIRSQGGVGYPSDTLGNAMISEIKNMSKDRRTKILGFLDPSNKFYGERVVYSDRLLRLLEQIYNKGSVEPNKDNNVHLKNQLARIESEYQNRNILLSLYLLNALDVSSQHPDFSRYQKLYTQVMTLVRKDHGCAFSEGGKIDPGLFHDVRNRMAVVFPMALILDSDAKGCRVDVKIHANTLSERESDVNAKVITEMVETEQSRRQREKAMGAAAGDVWKDAFQRISKASERTQKVWSNFDKYRTRTESRASGEYLISYKGNPNVPASSVETLPQSSSAPGAMPTGMREKKTITKDYYLYTSHYTDISIAIFDQGKKVLFMDHMKNRFETKNSCRSQSVDGNSFSLLAGNCFRGNQSFRSPFITDTVENAMTTYIVEKRLPVVVKNYASLYQSEKASQMAEATLGSLLYGGHGADKGVRALDDILTSVEQKKTNGVDTIRKELVLAIQKAQMQ